MTWTPARLGDVMTLKRGHDLPESRRTDGDIPIVSSSGITGYHDEAKAQAPGVVTGRYGTLGEVFYVDHDYWPLNTALYVVDFKGNDPRFVAYVLRNALRNYQSDKAAVPGVNRNVLHELEVQTADLTTQERIAAFLSRYDDFIANNARRIELLETAAHALYGEWFVRLRFPGHEHVSLTDGVPDGWGRQRIGDCVTLHYGKSLPEHSRVDGKYPVFGSSGLVGTHESPLVEGPGIIVGRKGNIGSVYWSSRSYHPIDTVYFIGPNETNLYLYYALKGVQFVNTDVAVPGLNRDVAYSRFILRPSKELEREFISVVGTACVQVDRLTALNVKLSEARDLLLPRVMSGKVVV
jgi:type I restriction enzyme S subunit